MVCDSKHPSSISMKTHSVYFSALDYLLINCTTFTSTGDITAATALTERVGGSSNLDSGRLASPLASCGTSPSVEEGGLASGFHPIN